MCAHFKTSPIMNLLRRAFSDGIFINTAVLQDRLALFLSWREKMEHSLVPCIALCDGLSGIYYSITRDYVPHVNLALEALEA
jgi:hypothetical protein